MPLYKLVASQAKCIYSNKNLREKEQSCCASIYFNRQCLKLGVIPKYAQINVPYTSPASKVTQRKVQLSRVKEEIKYLYMKKEKLNDSLYKTHLQAASEWGKCWHLIQDNTQNTINKKSVEIYKVLDKKLSQLIHIQKEKIEDKHKFFPRVTNLTDINFTKDEISLLNKGLKYNLGQKWKNWIQNLSLEAECAITLLPYEEQDYMQHRVAKQIGKLYSQQTTHRAHTPKQAEDLKI